MMPYPQLIDNAQTHRPFNNLTFGRDLAIVSLVKGINKYRHTSAWRSSEAKTPIPAKKHLRRLLLADCPLATAIYQQFSLADDPEIVAENPKYVIDTCIRCVAAHAVMDRFHNLLVAHSQFQRRLPTPDDFDDLMHEIVRLNREGQSRRFRRFRIGTDTNSRDFSALMTRIECEASDRLGLTGSSPVIQDRILAHLEIFKAMACDEESLISNDISLPDGDFQ